ARVAPALRAQGPWRVDRRPATVRARRCRMMSEGPSFTRTGGGGRRQPSAVSASFVTRMRQHGLSSMSLARRPQPTVPPRPARSALTLRPSSGPSPGLLDRAHGAGDLEVFARLKDEHPDRRAVAVGLAI